MPKKPAKKPVPVKALRTVAKTHGKGQLVSVQTARILDRRYKVMEMRKQGCPLHEISNILGVSGETIRQDIQEVLGATATKMFETAEEARNLEITRMDALLFRYQPLAEAGNMAAANLVLTVSAMRRKLLALDIPETKRVDETGIRVYVGVDVDAV